MNIITQKPEKRLNNFKYFSNQTEKTQINPNKFEYVFKFFKKGIDKSFTKSYYFVSEKNRKSGKLYFLEDLFMIFEKVVRILAEQLDADPDKITPQTRIAEDLNADSLDVVELVMAVEEEFDIQIPDEEIEGLKTVEAVVEYIQANIE